MIYMKHRHFLSGICLAVAVMFLMSVSVHPAMAADAVNKQIDCATCGGMNDLSSIPGFEGKKIPTISIREISPENPGGAAAGLTSGTAAAVSGAQTQHFSSAITLTIRDPRSELQANSLVKAAGSPGNQDPVLAGIIANMSSAGYDFTGESSARYESTVQSDDFLNLNASQKQALATGGFALTADDTILSHRDAIYYTFTNRTMQTRIYVMGVQRIDAGGNPVGERTYSISPEFTPDGSSVKTAAAPGMVRAASSGKSCFWYWLAVSLAAAGLILLIISLIAGMYATGTIVGVIPVITSIVGTALANNWAAWYIHIDDPELCSLLTYEPVYEYAFSAATLLTLVGVLVAFLLLMYLIYLAGVCEGLWGRDVWMNHDWDHEGGEFGLADNGKPTELYVHDRIMLSLFADTKADKDAQWTIASQGKLTVRKTVSLKTRNGTWQSWIVEASGLGNQVFTLKYETSKPVPSTMERTDYTLPITVKEIPWTITTVAGYFTPWDFEHLFSITQYVSLAFDPSGVPHISYSDREDSPVIYATLANGVWSRENLKDSYGYRTTSLAFDPAGNPGICSGGPARNMDFRCAYRNGTAWSFTTIADWKDEGYHTGYFSSQVIDPEGIPHIVYNNGKSGDAAALMYATKNGTVWTNTVIQKTQNYDPSPALDKAGLLHIAYSTDGSGGPIEYAEQDGSGKWQVKTVANAFDSSNDKNRHAGFQLSLALDSLGNPHISYYDELNKDLKYVSWNGTDWKTETVHSTGDVGKFSSLAINANDQPFIAYYDATDQELRFATRNPGSDRWSIHTVDSSKRQISGCGVGEYASLALDTSGHPNIAYYDCPDHALKYAGWKG